MNPIEERYEGNFIDALDLPEGELVAVTVEKVAAPRTERDSAKKVIKNAIISFSGWSKRLVLNKTNYRNLKAMFGTDPDKWIGQRIRIQRRYLDAARGFGIQNTLCVRIVPPIGTPILNSAANYMGQPHPYPDEEAERARRTKAKAKPEANSQPLTDEQVAKITAAAEQAIPPMIQRCFAEQMTVARRRQVIEAIADNPNITHAQLNELRKGAETVRFDDDTLMAILNRISKAMETRIRVPT